MKGHPRDLTHCFLEQRSDIRIEVRALLTLLMIILEIRVKLGRNVSSQQITCSMPGGLSPALGNSLEN